MTQVRVAEPGLLDLESSEITNIGHALYTSQAFIICLSFVGGTH